MKFVFVLCLAIISSSAAIAKVPAKAASCGACHGQNGDKPLMPNYPKINNQNAAYLESAIKAYRSGDRKGGMAAVMTSQAKMLSDAEIKELAAFYAAKP